MTLLLCVALTAFAVLVTGVQARRRRPRSATRWLGAALLPVGAYLTGLLTLTARIVDAVVRWATSLVLSPVTWVGLGLLAAGLVLLVGAGLFRRGAPVKAAQDAPGGGVGDGGQKDAKSPRRRRRRRLTGRTGAASSPSAAPGADDDFAEVEEILRRRGL